MEDCDRFESEFPITNYFIYKNKMYPFNAGIFKIFSKKIDLDMFNKLIYINLLDDSEKGIQLSDDSISYFISYCQNLGMPKEILNNNNIISINYLSKKYNVQSLIKLTDNYISENRDN